MSVAASASSMLGASWEELGWLALSGVAIYGVVLLVVRVNGLRSFSKMSSVDFVVTIAIGSVVASVAATTTPVAAGVCAVVVLFGVQFLATTMRRHDRGLLDNTPEVLMIGPELRHDVMRRRRITEGDVRGKLRESGAVSLDDVICVILETTGDVSVLKRQQGGTIDPWILDDVKGSDLVVEHERRRTVDVGDSSAQ